jgi:cell division protein FtsW
MQKYGYVPLHESDFIFPVIGEELGLVCTLGVVLAFAVIVVCGVTLPGMRVTRSGCCWGRA